VFLDEVRRRRRRPTEALPDDAERVLVGAPAADEAATVDLPDYIQAALGRLSEDHRAALVLCDVIGMSYPEIAEALDVPVGTVRSRIHRGRSAMREMLLPHLEVDQ
jgi:RNA polymerase sigma-70 factor, ECF subfamily